MAGRLKHAERSHKTHHRNDEISKHFYHSNAVRANIKKIENDRRSSIAKIMGLIKKGDR